MTKSEFYSEWLNCFASDISKKDIEKYVVSTGDYLWHIFSFGLIDEKAFLTGDGARKAYDRADKNNAFYIEWFDDEEARALTPELCIAKALDGKTEIYVVAEDFSWTYVKTHESTCGPYFIKL